MRRDPVTVAIVTVMILLFVAMGLLIYKAATDHGPSCAQRGGHLVQDPPTYINSNNVLIPIAQSHCEIP